LIFKGVPSFFSSLFSWLGFLPLSIVNQLRCDWRKITNSEFRIEEIVYCGPEFDDLWNRVSKHYSAISVRTANILNWCYGVKDNGVLKYKILACFERDSISGYAVCRVIESPRLQLKRLQIVDIFVEPKREDVVLALLSSIINVGMKLDAAIVEFTGGIEWIDHAFRSTKPFTRSSLVVPPYYLIKDSTLSEKLADSSVWCYTDYDSDVIL
jgi:hypothetical protein